MVIWTPNFHGTWHLNCEPFDERTNPHDPNTKLVCYSEHISIANFYLFVIQMVVWIPVHQLNGDLNTELPRYLASELWTIWRANKSPWSKYQTSLLFRSALYMQHKLAAFSNIMKWSKLPFGRSPTINRTHSTIQIQNNYNLQIQGCDSPCSFLFSRFFQCQVPVKVLDRSFKLG